MNTSVMHWEVTGRTTEVEFAKDGECQGDQLGALRCARALEV